jgi:hypothetical protein
MSKEFNAQTEAEFQNLMPISGTMDTFFGGFELDHSFPTHEAAEQIYDLMNHQRAAQLCLWVSWPNNLIRQAARGYGSPSCECQ